MATKTADNAAVEAEPKKRRALINTFDSPWLNTRFLIGCAMVGFVVLVGLVGPLFWDTELALVASSPLNLPPMWVQGTQPQQPEPAAVDEASESDAAAQPETEPTSASGFGSSGLGGSGLSSLMATQVPAQPTSASGFGSSGLGGSGLSSLMATEAPAQPTSASGFGSSGLGGSGLGSLMSTQTPPDASTESSSSDSTSSTSSSSFATTRTVFLPSGDPAHPLGTDNSGRDILAVLIVGAPASLRVGVIAAAIGIFVGIALGFSAGFLGGWWDTVVRTASDVTLTIPSLAVLLVISAYLRRVDLETMALLLALFAWPGPTRLLRAQVLTMRERGYVRMAQLSGQSTISIMFREMMPNMLPYLAASFAGNVSAVILAAASLEALGLGPTRYPTLGTTIFHSLRATAIMRGMWWWWGFPVLTLIFIFTGLFLIAVGLDEIANPRLRGVQGES